MGIRLAFSIFLILLGLVEGDELTHRYEPQEVFYAWTNRVGPYHNPHETYDYFSLPFCRPNLSKEIQSKKGGISEMVFGSQLQNSGISFMYGVDLPSTTLCAMEMNSEEALKLQEAISNHYWYQMEIDGLPIWAKIGDLDLPQDKLAELESHGSHHDAMPEHSLLYRHRHFTFGMNGDQIVEVNMTSSDPIKIEADRPLFLSVSSSWVLSSTPFNQRFNRYIAYNFFESQIHWFSIFNSFMIVVFLAGLVAIIMMRTLNMDYMRYSQELADETVDTSSVRDDSGWKRVHGDVFRPSDKLVLYSVVVGNGAHLLFTLVLSLVLIVLTTSYVGHDRVTVTALCVYIACYFVNGYVSGSRYKQAFFPRASPEWQKTMMISAVLLPAVFVILYSLLAMLSVAKGTMSVFPWRMLFALLGIWLIVCLPLHTIGTIVGRSVNGNPANPCRVSSLPSPIPPAPFYARPLLISLFSGFLPFGSFFIEIFFIFASIWSYKYYYVYGFLAFMMVVLIIIETCISIVGTYVLLNNENYHWRWTSFMSGCSIGVYIFLYCIYYYMFKTEMNGIIQSAYFLVESFFLVILVSLCCGFVSNIASEFFVKRIFKNIKVD